MQNSSILAQEQHGAEAGESERELEAIIREARRRARRRRLKIALAGLGVAAAAGTAAIVLLSGGSDEGDADSGGAAATGPTGPAEYTRIETTSLMTTGGPDTGVYSLRFPVVEEVWVGEDGSGRVSRQYLPNEWPGPRDRRRAIAAGDQRSLAQVEGRRLPEPTDAEMSSWALDDAVGAPGYPTPSALPSAPGPLRRMLVHSPAYGDNVPPRESLFELVVGVLVRPNVESSVKAAAFELALRIPGVHVDPLARDPRGRRATAVSFSPRGLARTNTFYFDAEARQALAYEERYDHVTQALDSRLVGSTVLSRTRTVESIPPPAPAP